MAVLQECFIKRFKFDRFEKETCNEFFLQNKLLWNLKGLCQEILEVQIWHQLRFFSTTEMCRGFDCTKKQVTFPASAGLSEGAFFSGRAQCSARGFLTRCYALPEEIAK